MDELVDILDEQGKHTGNTCLKSVAHKNGYWHPCIHVWLYTKKGEVVIQKRVDDKDTFPGLWDVSVAGHIGAGEVPLLAAQRELFEELGADVKTDALEFIGNHTTDHMHNAMLIDREYHHVYITVLTIPLSDLKLQAEEVSQIKLIPVDSLKHDLLDDRLNKSYVPYNKEYVTMVCKAIKEKVKNIKRVL
ncbi:NUDIX hydrolase [Snuella sedimenti]|uniref:NUDIX domain-containing protein n=1 Tax=Snuella sedimenti TaxID=2798802 RepID=A0A8J7LPX2_9FLAO|nr:NUDIX domain-containing protein [Snuella sedimenti]MBJ6369564.1 NUDIX domain-containing protein [Snuella sedimenti]